jgi:hypothetical protein
MTTDEFGKKIVHVRDREFRLDETIDEQIKLLVPGIIIYHDLSCLESYFLLYKILCGDIEKERLRKYFMTVKAAKVFDAGFRGQNPTKSSNPIRKGDGKKDFETVIESKWSDAVYVVDNETNMESETSLV